MATESDLQEYLVAHPGAFAHLEGDKLIVSAIGSVQGETQVGSDIPLRKALEAAMVRAVMDAIADGVSLSNSEKILSYKHEYRAAVFEGREADRASLQNQ